jgi:hypothetical protein
VFPWIYTGGNAYSYGSIVFVYAWGILYLSFELPWICVGNLASRRAKEGSVAHLRLEKRLVAGHALLVKN